MLLNCVIYLTLFKIILTPGIFPMKMPTITTAIMLNCELPNKLICTRGFHITILNVLSSLIIASAFLSGIVSANTVNGGRVNFEGELVSAACAVDMSSMNQTVHMGQVRTASFATTGATSSAVPFDIKLTGCAPVGTPAAPQTVAVGFLGVTSSANPEALAISGGAGTATGLGIQIRDSAGNPVRMNGTPSTSHEINRDTMSIPFQASYISTAATVTAGTANATATFALTYQ